MAHWAAGAEWGEPPAPYGQCATLLALSLSEWLGLNTVRFAYQLIDFMGAVDSICL